MPSSTSLAVPACCTNASAASGADRAEGVASAAGPCRRRRRRRRHGVGSGRQALAARQHDVGAEAAHELLVGRARIGEHAEPRPLRERDHVRREQAGAAGDEQRRAGGEVEQLEAAQRREAVHRQRRRLLERRARGNATRRIAPARRGAPTAHRPRAVAASTAAITSSPTRERARPPHRPTRRRRRRPCPAPTAAARPRRRAARSAMSVGFTAAALTAIRTSPAPGSRTSRSTTRSTSGPPGSTTRPRAPSSQPWEQLRDGVDRVVGPAPLGNEREVERRR